MTDNRTTSRRKVLKPGTIAWDHDAGIDCVVRNLSANGACLEVASPVGIPDRFKLVLDGTARPCEVAWRKATRIGIRFA